MTDRNRLWIVGAIALVVGLFAGLLFGGLVGGVIGYSIAAVDAPSAVAPQVEGPCWRMDRWGPGGPGSPWGEGFPPEGEMPPWNEMPPEGEMPPWNEMPPGHPVVSGAMVVDLLPGSAAERAGLREGDVIVALDDRPITPERSLVELLAPYRPGDRVVLMVIREGSEHYPEVVLDAHPQDASRPYLGVRVVPFPPSDVPTPMIP